MTNDPGDRHVLAAAVRAQAELIVTYNRRHFPANSVQPWEIEVQSPSTFLRGLYDLEPGLFVRKLHEQAEAIGVPLETAAQPVQERLELCPVFPRGTRHRVRITPSPRRQPLAFRALVRTHKHVLEFLRGATGPLDDQATGGVALAQAEG